MSDPKRPHSVRVAAPAKINLGLEILGCRDDGYHEVATILQAIRLHDQITLEPGDGIRPTRLLPDIPDSENLALRALRLLSETTGGGRGARLDLRKSIPTAAGLGGASADAAAALLAARDLWRVDIGDEELVGIAADLGSDVPFFLQGGTALATGRGERLAPLPTPALWAILVCPKVHIPRKTAVLYDALRPDDFSAGASVHSQADRLRAGLPPDSRLLGNAFARALYGLRPELADLPPLMRANGAADPAISGAGPSHYALFGDPEEAAAVAKRLEPALSDAAEIVVTATRQEPIRTIVTNH